MQKNVNNNLERYRIKLDDILGYHLLDDSEDGEYLSDPLLKNLFLSAVPSINDNSKEVDDLVELYPLIYLYPAYKKTASTAFMLTGKYGCGKRTADKFFSGIIYSLFGDEPLDEELRYYWINSSELTQGTSPEICNNINRLFDELISVLTDECKMETLVYISFGNINGIMKHKKIAECFNRRVTQLKETPDVVCIITCCYEGTASGIKDRYKAPFVVYEMKEPDTHIRSLYFERMLGKYRNIILEPDISEMASMTENCTFSMLENIKMMILMSAKGMALSKELDWDNYINNNKIPDEERLKINTDDIKNIISNVKECIYAPSLKNNIPMNYVQTPEMPVPKIVIENPYAEKTDRVTSENENIAEPDNFTELFSIRDSILPSVNYTPVLPTKGDL